MRKPGGAPKCRHLLPFLHPSRLFNPCWWRSYSYTTQPHSLLSHPQLRLPPPLKFMRRQALMGCLPNCLSSKNTPVRGSPLAPKSPRRGPVAGSIILAAVLLKLGGYGMIPRNSHSNPPCILRGPSPYNCPRPHLLCPLLPGKH
uniref:Uncharacterized protein n=1 Tax=Gouania willdenowi TaxID=441366 RepID=A0A8C5H7K9_GOUWI